MGLVRRSCNGSDVTRNPETWQDSDTVDAVSYEERCDEVSALRDEVVRLKDEKRCLEILLFERGAMLNAPCFKCGYNSEGYFQPEYHDCAKLHHKWYKPSEEE